MKKRLILVLFILFFTVMSMFFNCVFAQDDFLSKVTSNEEFFEHKNIYKISDVDNEKYITIDVYKSNDVVLSKKIDKSCIKSYFVDNDDILHIQINGYLELEKSTNRANKYVPLQDYIITPDGTESELNIIKIKNVIEKGITAIPVPLYVVDNDRENITYIILRDESYNRDFLGMKHPIYLAYLYYDNQSSPKLEIIDTITSIKHGYFIGGSNGNFYKLQHKVINGGISINIANNISFVLSQNGQLVFNSFYDKIKHLYYSKTNSHNKDDVQKSIQLVIEKKGL